MNTIELIDEYGETREFILLDTFGMDEEYYAVLTDTVESEEAIILKVLYDEETVEFQVIEDEEELKDAWEVYRQLLKEQEQ